MYIYNTFFLDKAHRADMEHFYKKCKSKLYEYIEINL
jgi:hypothetical protein